MRERERDVPRLFLSLSLSLSDVAPWSSVKAFSRRDRDPSVRGRTDRPPLLLGCILSTNALFSSPRIFSPA